MRILYIDVDSLRPDHLGCYGYHRDTSPNMDGLARKGLRFENVYVSDAPCLPSRTALFSGRFGIHNGVVNHGGTAADLCLQGRGRGFHSLWSDAAWMDRLVRAGYHTCCISPFPRRHSAWHFLAGFREAHDTGKGGMETADETQPFVLRWLDAHAQEENWFLHVNYWDPHTPYNTPASYGNPFADDPPPAWLTDACRQRHYNGYGPHCAHEPGGFGDEPGGRYARVPDAIDSMENWCKWIDGYDTGIRYTDAHIGEVMDLLRRKGVFEDTLVIITADHGENQGELNVYGDHQTADQMTCRIPLIMHGPEIAAGMVDEALHYHLDLAPTITDLVGGECPAIWDGRSYISTLRDGRANGREELVVSQGAWSCQRAVRWDRWILIRTYHDGFKDFPDFMLFDLEADPHETQDLAAQRPEVLGDGLARLDVWHADMMRTSHTGIDPMWTVLEEGGPHHANHRVLERYCRRLRRTGRAHHAETLQQRHGKRA